MFIPVRELLRVYATGWFPMATPDGELRLFSPDPRGILPLDTFHIPHGTRKLLRDPKWSITCDKDFPAVLAGCAQREETWIDSRIAASYIALHRAGHAHSIEVWHGGRLAGGLYGVRIGAAFFGESMFHTESGASKVALVALVNILRQNGFQLLDLQWITPHLCGFGATEIRRDEYLRRLHGARHQSAHFPTCGELSTDCLLQDRIPSCPA